MGWGRRLWRWWRLGRLRRLGNRLRSGLWLRRRLLRLWRRLLRRRLLRRRLLRRRMLRLWRRLLRRGLPCGLSNRLRLRRDWLLRLRRLVWRLLRWWIGGRLLQIAVVRHGLTVGGSRVGRLLLTVAHGRISLLFRILRIFPLQMEDRVDDDAQLGAVLSRILVLP